MPNAQSVNHDLGQRLQALALAEFGVAQTVVTEITGLSRSSVSRLKKQARERGYDPSVSRALKLEYVEDAPRSGRPPIPKETEDAILEKLANGNRNVREMPAGLIAYEHNQTHEQRVSPTSVLRILKRNGYHPCKKITMPGLTNEMKEARLKFCLEHEYWDLEDWKNVIWTDETSVVLGARRGMRIRVWRKAHERCHQKVLKTNHKKYSEFMFCGCFSYDQKGHMHIWKKETAAEKKEATEFIAELNKTLEPIAREKWQREQDRKLALRRRRGGRKAVFNFKKRNGKCERKTKGRIDWYRYQREILSKKLFPFAQTCLQTRPKTIVIEDGAPSHISKYQRRAWISPNVVRSFWPGNSPDLNMIEPCWAWMKRATTRKGAPQDRKTAEMV
jgi:hypothetical protein